MLPADTFIANEAHWFTLDVVYLVVVRGGAVSGARVGGQQMPSGLKSYSTDPLDYADPDLVRRHIGLDSLSPEFLRADRRNFRLDNAEIREARISNRRSLWTGPIPNAGVITLSPRSGRRRRLILLGAQNVIRIHGLLSSSGVPVLPLAG